MLSASLLPSLEAPLSPSSDPSPRKIQTVLCLWLIMNVLLNYDHGVVPAIAGDLQIEFGLDFSQEGWLISLVFIGLSIGSPLAGGLYYHLPPKLVLVSSLLLEIGATFCFAMSRSLPSLYFWRFAMGVLQIFGPIYVPVWVDDFAPRDLSTRWMSYAYVSTAGGQLLGYAIGSLVQTFGRPYITWHANFVVQALLLIPVTFAFLLTPSSLLSSAPRVDTPLSNRHGAFLPSVNTRSPWRRPRGHSLQLPAPSHHSRTGPAGDAGGVDYMSSSPLSLEHREPGRIDSLYVLRGQPSPLSRQKQRATIGAVYHGGGGGGTPEPFPPPSTGSSPHREQRKAVETESTRSDLRECLLILLENKLYMLLTLSLSVLYFTVTGIQSWVKQYMSDKWGLPRLTIAAVYVTAAATAPVIGVVGGSRFVDANGGYKGRNRLHALKYVTFCAFLAAFFAICAAGSKGPFWFGVFLWLCMLFGATVVPVAVGILMSCIPPELKAFSSAFSQFCYQALGYAAAPPLIGVLMDLVGGDHSVQVGFAVCLCWSFLGFVLCLLAYVYEGFYGGCKKIKGKARHDVNTQRPRVTLQVPLLQSHEERLSAFSAPQSEPSLESEHYKWNEEALKPPALPQDPSKSTSDDFLRDFEGKERKEGGGGGEGSESDSEADMTMEEFHYELARARMGSRLI